MEVLFSWREAITWPGIIATIFTLFIYYLLQDVISFVFRDVDTFSFGHSESLLDKQVSHNS